MQSRVEPNGSRRLANCWASPKAAARNKGFNSIRRSSFYGLVVWTIPWSQGKTQGISPIPPPFREIRLENLCDSRNLRGKSLRGTRRRREFFRARGELFPPFRPRQGKWHKIDPLAATKHLLRVVASAPPLSCPRKAVPNNCCVSSTVIASAAKQSRSHSTRPLDCFVARAPRNDGQ
jgi:hypothetical protein